MTLTAYLTTFLPTDVSLASRLSQLATYPGFDPRVMMMYSLTFQSISVRHSQREGGKRVILLISDMVFTEMSSDTRLVR